MTNHEGVRQQRRTVYEQSIVDWARLRAFAVRVAQETRKPKTDGLWYRDPRSGEQVRALGPHWPLDERKWQRRDTARFSGGTTEESESISYRLALLTDGQLVSCRIEEHEVVQIPGGRIFHEITHRVDTSLPDVDVTRLDFNRVHYSSKPGKVQAWGDLEPGPVLVRHSKGVGPSLALKELMQA